MVFVREEIIDGKHYKIFREKRRRKRKDGSIHEAEYEFKREVGAFRESRRKVQARRRAKIRKQRARIDACRLVMIMELNSKISAGHIREI